jgi:hypothetical protein
VLDAVLGVNCVVALAILPSRAVLAAHLTVRPQTLARLIEGGVNLALTVWLTSRLGLVGTVLSTSLAALATSFWYLPRLTLRTLDLESCWIRETSRKIAVFTLRLLPAAWLGRSWATAAGGFAGAAAGSLFTVACGLSLLWATLLDSWLKGRIIAALASMLGDRPPKAAPLGANAAAK